MSKREWIVLGVVAAFLVGAFLGSRLDANFGRNGGISVKVDTLIVRDTIVKNTPIPVITETVRTEYVEVHDTIIRDSTIFVPMPIEQKVYQDEEYRAVISGWHPSLDSMTVYPKTKIVTVNATETVVRSPRMGFGIMVGPSVVYDFNEIHGGVGATVGVCLRF